MLWFWRHKWSLNNYVDTILRFFWPPITSTTVDSFRLNVDKSRHFWTTYPPHPVNTVCERTLSLTWTSKLVQSKTGTFSYFDKMKCVAFQFNNSFKILLAHIHRVELILSNFMNNEMGFDIHRYEWIIFRYQQNCCYWYTCFEWTYYLL